MPGIDKKAVAKRVRDRRRKLGLSQKALALAAGMKQQGIQNIESELVARPRNLLELAAALLTSPEWILHGRGAEVVRPQNPVEEITSIAGDLSPDKQGAALQFLRTLRDQSGDEAA